MKTIKTLLILLLCSGTAIAQGNLGEIHGTLLDIDTKTPLGYSSVFVEYGGNKIGAETDENGRFVIKPLQSGTYTVYYQMFTGEKQPIMSDVKVKPNKIARAGTLLASEDSLPEIDVVSYKFKLIDPEDPSAQTMDAKQIKQSARIRDPKAMLATMDSGIKLDSEGNISFRGARQNNVVYIVDGVKTTNMNMPGMSYESVTAYTGGLPAKYGDTTGGVVIVESKSYFDYYRAWKTQQEQNNQ